MSSLPPLAPPPPGISTPKPTNIKLAVPCAPPAPPPPPGFAPPPATIPTTVTNAAAPPPPPPTAPLLGAIPATKRRLSASFTPAKEEFSIDKNSIENAIPYDITIPIKWGEILGFECLGGAENSTGVILVEVKPRQFVVVKGSASIATEIFAAEFATEFFGLEAPKHKMIEYAPNFFKSKDRDWREIKNHLARVAGKRGRFANKIEKDLNRAFFILMEFMPHAVTLAKLEDAPKEKIQVIMNPFESTQVENGCTTTTSSTTPEPKRLNTYLQDLGEIHIMDIVLNNWDRVPGMMWDHDGNAGNIMFSESTKRGLAIDQVTSQIIDEKGKQAYLERVQQFCKHINECQKLETIGNAQPVASICDFLLANLPYGTVEIPEVAKREILNGMLKGLEKAKKIQLQDLEKLKQRVDVMKTGSDWDNVWFTSVLEIGCEFMYSIIETIKTHHQHQC